MNKRISPSPLRHRFSFTVLSLLLLAGCREEKKEPEQPPPPPGTEAPESFQEYMQLELTPAEQLALIDSVRSVLGTPYVWGGDTRETGFDCSGLIQWAYRELGVNRFRNEEAVYHEIASHELSLYNTIPIPDIDQARRGDFVFFDVNSDGRITHNAILDNVDEEGNVWVYDAYSIHGKVVHRKVEDFWNKGPTFGRPLKTVPRSPNGG